MALHVKLGILYIVLHCIIASVYAEGSEPLSLYVKTSQLEPQDAFTDEENFIADDDLAELKSQFPKAYKAVVRGKEGNRIKDDVLPGLLIPLNAEGDEVFVPEELIKGAKTLIYGGLKQIKTLFSVSRKREANRRSSGPAKREVKGQMAKGMPFSFQYIVDDEPTANYQTRHEEGDKEGVVRGCYQLLDPFGKIRTVIYRADSDGFRIIAIKKDSDKVPCTGFDEGDGSGVGQSAPYKENSPVNLKNFLVGGYDTPQIQSKENLRPNGVKQFPITSRRKVVGANQNSFDKQSTINTSKKSSNTLQYGTNIDQGFSSLKINNKQNIKTNLAHDRRTQRKQTKQQYSHQNLKQTENIATSHQSSQTSIKKQNDFGLKHSSEIQHSVLGTGGINVNNFGEQLIGKSVLDNRKQTNILTNTHQVKTTHNSNYEDRSKYQTSQKTSNNVSNKQIHSQKNTYSNQLNQYGQQQNQRQVNKGVNNQRLQAVNQKSIGSSSFQYNKESKQSEKQALNQKSFASTTQYNGRSGQNNGINQKTPLTYGTPTSNNYESQTQQKTINNQYNIQSTQEQIKNHFNIQSNNKQINNQYNIESSNKQNKNQYNIGSNNKQIKNQYNIESNNKQIKNQYNIKSTNKQIKNQRNIQSNAKRINNRYNIQTNQKKTVNQGTTPAFRNQAKTQYNGLSQQQVNNQYGIQLNQKEINNQYNTQSKRKEVNNQYNIQSNQKKVVNQNAAQSYKTQTKNQFQHQNLNNQHNVKSNYQQVNNQYNKKYNTQSNKQQVINHNRQQQINNQFNIEPELKQISNQRNIESGQKQVTTLYNNRNAKQVAQNHNANLNTGYATQQYNAKSQATQTRNQHHRQRVNSQYKVAGRTNYQSGTIGTEKQVNLHQSGEENTQQVNARYNTYNQLQESKESLHNSNQKQRDQTHNVGKIQTLYNTPASQSQVINQNTRKTPLQQLSNKVPTQVPISQQQTGFQTQITRNNKHHKTQVANQNKFQSYGNSHQTTNDQSLHSQALSHKSSSTESRLSKHLQNLSKILFNSVSTETTGGYGSSFINFPFVLIPATKFIELRNKGLIGDSVKGFGTLIETKVNDGHNANQNTRTSASYGTSSLESQEHKESDFEEVRYITPSISGRTKASNGVNTANFQPELQHGFTPIISQAANGAPSSLPQSTFNVPVPEQLGLYALPN